MATADQTTYETDTERVATLIDVAENATFHAANSAQSFLAPSEDRNRLIDELLEVNNRLRGLEGQSRIYRAGEVFDYGHRDLSPTGRIWKRLRKAVRDAARVRSF